MIDSLDASMERLYHHEGPYDATLLSRNMEKKFSPVEAVRGSNEEALKATPRENIRDALDKHVPLHGTAMVPPGTRNEFGDVYDYTEGADLMREPDAPGGAYKRWDGVVSSDLLIFYNTIADSEIRSICRKIIRGKANHRFRTRER